MASEDTQTGWNPSGSSTQSESASNDNYANAPALSNSEAVLTEDQALALLERRELPPESIEQLSENPAAMKSRKVCVAVAAHPRSPRHLALRLIRQFYSFDLMQFALLPAVAADLRRLADEQLVGRLASITLGERLTLAHRASETVASALLLDKESRVSQAVLENRRLTEASICKAVTRPNASAVFIEAVCAHSKWALRREIRIALLRNQHTPPARAMEFARPLASSLVRDILRASRLPDQVKACLLKESENRK
jgi:hypothetical protein